MIILLQIIFICCFCAISQNDSNGQDVNRWSLLQEDTSEANFEMQDFFPLLFVLFPFMMKRLKGCFSFCQEIHVKWV